MQIGCLFEMFPFFLKKKVSATKIDESCSCFTGKVNDVSVTGKTQLAKKAKKLKISNGNKKRWRENVLNWLSDRQLSTDA